MRFYLDKDQFLTFNFRKNKGNVNREKHNYFQYFSLYT